MKLKFDSNDSGRSLAISGEMTIYNAEKTASLMFANDDLAAITLTVDMSAVTELDTAGVQILLMLRKQMGEQGTLNISPCNPVAASVLSQFKLLDDLGVESI